MGPAHTIPTQRSLSTQPAGGVRVRASAAGCFPGWPARRTRALSPRGESQSVANQAQTFQVHQSQKMLRLWEEPTDQALTWNVRAGAPGLALSQG